MLLEERDAIALLHWHFIHRTLNTERPSGKTGFSITFHASHFTLPPGRFMHPITLHLLPNAHLDPVWLWDWREGLNEGIITCRTVLDLMDEFPDLTFVRGEAAIYAHIEQHDPETFARIRQRVAEGRWDVVGGTWVQPDTNLTGTETFNRHFLYGKAYFNSRFGRAPEVAWAADSFGHSTGLPDILAGAGMTGFAFNRPQTLPFTSQAFWWEGAAGGRVLGCHIHAGWYGSERDETIRRLDLMLEKAPDCRLPDIGVFMGLGDHGGGPTRRSICEVREWAARHPEVKVEFSTLHRLLAKFRAADAAQPGLLPVHRGEMNYCLRGCYVSMARIKHPYRRGEALVARAETTASAVAAGLAVPAARDAAKTLCAPWHDLMFNSFHDILPGSSIERACDEQVDWLGGTLHHARQAEFTALNRLAMAVDTRRLRQPLEDHPGTAQLLIWNPHPFPYAGPMELEAPLDYRMIWDYKGRMHELPLALRGPDGASLPFQVIATEHDCIFGAAETPCDWRRRVVAQMTLPPLGWQVVEMGWEEDAPKPPAGTGLPARAMRSNGIGNGVYEIRARRGAKGIEILRDGQPLFAGTGLGVVTVEDPWGSWGAMDEAPESLCLNQVRDVWTVKRVAVTEAGPERAVLRVRLAGGKSELDLEFQLSRGRPAVDVHARLFLNERSARVKLVMPAGDQVEFEVPGGTVRRGPEGEVPGGRWARVADTAGKTFGFACDTIYGYEASDGVFRASLARASRYACDTPATPEGAPWRPVTDRGELRFQFLFCAGGEELPRLARQLEQPPVALLVPPKSGALPRQGGFAAVTPDTLDLLALKPAEAGDGWILRLRETAGRTTTAQLRWLGHDLTLGEVAPSAMATWRLTPDAGGWRATRVNAAEEAIP
jgi:alpha-mannosidase